VACNSNGSENRFFSPDRFSEELHQIYEVFIMKTPVHSIAALVVGTLVSGFAIAAPKPCSQCPDPTTPSAPAPPPAPATTVLDLTTTTSTGSLNGAIFTTTDLQPTGTGVINPFVRLNTNTSVERGYNTSARDVYYDENTSPNFTRDLLLTEIPTFDIGGFTYREFLLDVNEPSHETKKLLALDKFQLYVQSSGGLSGPIGNEAVFSNKVFDMDLGNEGNSAVLLDYTKGNGSGSGDLFVYVLDSLFTGGSFVTLFSQFGETTVDGFTGLQNDNCFEEWAVRTPVAPVPEPETYALMLAGLGVVGFVARRRKKA
jgi:hypothetical protein